MNLYPDAMSKMALCMSAAQLAKENLVDEFGIGEDLTFNFFGWKNGQLIVVAQLRQELSHQPMALRLGLSNQLLGYIRNCWNIDAISVVAEGFETLDKDALNGRELAVAFVEEKDLVRECITVTHCESNEMTSLLEVYLVSTTYSYTLGREMEWGSPIGFAKGTDTVLRNSPLPKILAACISMPVDGYPDDDEIENMIEHMESLGFNIQEFTSST